MHVCPGCLGRFPHETSAALRESDEVLRLRDEEIVRLRDERDAAVSARRLRDVAHGQTMLDYADAFDRLHAKVRDRDAEIAHLTRELVVAKQRGAETMREAMEKQLSLAIESYRYATYDRPRRKYPRYAAIALLAIDTLENVLSEVREITLPENVYDDSKS